MRKIGVIGLGYVGLPVALAFARKFPGVVGFDLCLDRVSSLKERRDINAEVEEAELLGTTLKFTDDQKDLNGLDFFVVAVPTPIDEFKRPDLSPLIEASRIVGRVIKPGAIVVFESTVYPGVTEEICGPIIAAESGLKASRDFKLGYSPERVNPGDREHTLERVIKVVSAEDQAALDIVAQVYGLIIEAGVHRAPSIKVAEAAKVIENTQRDLNIALMNELAIIFDYLGISTRDVLEAAGTKWNFLSFKPGLVGGHCIGVDPFYLTTKAEQVGYSPQVILAGRRINDGMGEYIANRTVKLMINSGFQIKASRVGILGLSFKENVSDTRNSRVPDIVHELAEFGVKVLVNDPLANVREAADKYAIELLPLEVFTGLDALIMAVPHQAYSDLRALDIERRLKPGGVFVDVKSLFRREDFSESVSYWSL